VISSSTHRTLRTADRAPFLRHPIAVPLARLESQRTAQSALVNFIQSKLDEALQKLYELDHEIEEREMEGEA
jgi:hypothetical protein